MENENSTKELDLIDIIKICWGWFVKFIWEPFIFVLKFVFKKWWVGVLAVAVGLTISFIDSSQFPKYTGIVVFKNNVCSSSDFVTNIRYFSHTPIQYKIDVMGADPQIIGKVRAVWGHLVCYTDTLHTGYIVDIADNKVGEGLEIVPNMFAVEISAKSVDVFDDFQNGLVRLFNSSEYFSTQNNLRINKLQHSLEITESESFKLDSVRNNLKGSVITSSNNIVNGQNVSTVLNPTVISKEIIRLNESASSIRNDLTYSASVVDVLSPIKYNNEPDNFYMYTWKSHVAWCLLVFYIFALLVVYRKQVLSFIKG